MHIVAVFFIVLFATSAIAAPTSSSKHVLHEKRTGAPRAWEKRGRVNPLQLLPVRIGLTQTNLDKGPRLLDEVSNPASIRYGQHYTVEQIHDIFAPHRDSVDSVSDWLHTSGIAPHRISLSVNKQWLQFDAMTSEVESLVKTTFHHYTDLHTGKSNIGCDEYHLPEHMRAHVDYITPGIKLLALRTKNQKRQKRDFGVFNKAHNLTQPKTRPMPQSLNSLMASPLSAICDVAIVPLCIQTLYDITSPTKHAVGNELGIVEALGQMYSQTDLNEFFASLAPNIPQGTHPTLDSVDGGTGTVTNISNAGSESDLDFQVSYPIIYPQNSILFQSDDDVYEANYTYEGLFNNFLDAIDGSYCTYSAYGETGNSPIDPPYPDPQPGGFKGALQCGIYKPTNVISISYAGPEYDAPISYQQRQCNEYMKLGMQGVSVVVSSGDQGVAGALNDDNPNGCLGSNASIFSPAFPASCPYVTSVGATSLPLGGDVAKDEETATTQFPSGGGFSNIFAVPHYQARAIATYFASAGAQHPFYTSTNNNSFGANGGVYNRNGRGFPDVSAIGQNVAVVVAGVPVLIGGTSVSSPVFAAVLNRINEERIAARKRTIGFVNPILYSHPQVLHDITVGSNPGCGTDGFTAAKGWDPVTGLGTPDYPAMVDLFMSMP